MSAASLDAFVADEASSVALQSSIAVLGLPPELASTADLDDIVDDVQRRVEGRPVAVLTHNDSVPQLTVKRGDPTAVGPAGPDALVAALRYADLTTVLDRSGATLPKHDVVHYEGPNGLHYQAFLRPGLALRGTGELDRVAFWLVEHVAGCSRFLVDHWSLVALAHHVGGYLFRLGLGDSPTQVESLERYGEDVRVLRSRLELAFAAGDDRLGVIVSVNSSGRLARDIAAAAEHAGLRPLMAALCESNVDKPASVPALLTLGDDFNPHEKPCPDCDAGGSTVVPIQADSYLLALAAYTRPQAVTRTDAQPAREFFDRYAGTGVSSVHRTHEDGRHHAFYVDVSKIADLPEFTSALADRLAVWDGTQIDIVLCPPYPAAQSVARHVGELLDVDVVAVDETRLDGLDLRTAETILGAGSVCVVDDVVITGTRLYRYRNQITQFRRRHGRDGVFDMRAVVGVARPPDEPTLAGLKDVTHHSADRPMFAAVETFLLPHWRTSVECPWCVEAAYLAQVSPDQAVGAIAERRDALANVAEGLSDNVFLPWSLPSDLRVRHPLPPEHWPDDTDVVVDKGPVNDRQMELNSGSVFGDVQHADLMLSVASAVQSLRSPHRSGTSWSDPRLDETFRSPVAKVLEPRLYLTGRYYEPVLVAAFLRAAHRHDLRSPTTDTHVVNALQDHLLRHDASRQLRAELVLAMARGTVPNVASDVPFDDADPTVGAALRAIVELAGP